MFDGAVCSRVEILRQSSAACDALHKLKTLLIEARQSSWSSGGDDTEVVTDNEWSAQPVSSVGTEPDAAPRDTSKYDCPPGENAARICDKVSDSKE
jgi:hypothetical protein